MAVRINQSNVGTTLWTALAVCHRTCDRHCYCSGLCLQQLFCSCCPFPSLDYIRTFTWDKKLEMVVKSTGILGGQGEKMLLCLLFELSSHIPWIIKKHGYQAWWYSVIPVLWSLRYGHLELKASFGYVRPPLYMQSKTKN